MRKKIISMILTLVLGAALLAGCNHSQGESITTGSAESLSEEMGSASSGDSYSEGMEDAPAITSETEPTESTSPGKSSDERAESSRSDDANETPSGSEVNPEDLQKGYLDFSLKLFDETVKSANNPGGNVMISPASILFALDMAAMGAEGKTYNQIASLIYPGAAKTDLNAMAESYMDQLTKSGEMKVANSLWADKSTLKNRNVEMKEDYQNLLSDSYDAEIRILDFDEAALDEINGWVSRKTDHMIDGIINEFPADVFLYLINAMAFEGEWETPYKEHQIDENGIFHNRDGHEETAKMLSSTEHFYLESDSATGFLKSYEGYQFAFLAILPKDESLYPEDFLTDFNGDAYREFYGSLNQEDVITKTPAFSFEYEKELSSQLAALGMTDAFSETQADFSSIAEADGFQFWISRILHKTYIELDESGTKAAAVTAVEMQKNSAAIVDFEEPKQVILDRPFVFAIVDMETGQPVFIGTVNTVE